MGMHKPNASASMNAMTAIGGLVPGRSWNRTSLSQLPHAPMPDKPYLVEPRSALKKHSAGGFNVRLAKLVPIDSMDKACPRHWNQQVSSEQTNGFERHQAWHHQTSPVRFSLEWMWEHFENERLWKISVSSGHCGGDCQVQSTVGYHEC